MRAANSTTYTPFGQLYYYRFRDYAPLIGRFCQTDPLGYVDGMNLYAYVNNNPLNWIDPWGLYSSLNDPKAAAIIKEMTGQVGTQELRRQGSMVVSQQMGNAAAHTVKQNLPLWKRALITVGILNEVTPKFPPPPPSPPADPNKPSPGPPNIPDPNTPTKS